MPVSTRYLPVSMCPPQCPLRPLHFHRRVAAEFFFVEARASFYPALTRQATKNRDINASGNCKRWPIEVVGQFAVGARHGVPLPKKPK